MLPARQPRLLTSPGSCVSRGTAPVRLLCLFHQVPPPVELSACKYLFNHPSSARLSLLRGQGPLRPLHLKQGLASCRHPGNAAEFLSEAVVTGGRGRSALLGSGGGTLSAHGNPQARLGACLPAGGFRRTPTKMTASGIFYGARPAPQ